MLKFFECDKAIKIPIAPPTITTHLMMSDSSGIMIAVVPTTKNAPAMTPHIE
jgi:hypothetical protein